MNSELRNENLNLSIIQLHSWRIDRISWHFNFRLSQSGSSVVQQYYHKKSMHQRHLTTSMNFRGQNSGSSSMLNRPRSTQSRKGLATGQGGQQTSAGVRQNNSMQRPGQAKLGQQGFSSTLNQMNGAGLNVTGMRAGGAQQTSGPQMAIIGVNSGQMGAGKGHPPRGNQINGRNSSIFANDSSPMQPAIHGSGYKASGVGSSNQNARPRYPAENPSQQNQQQQRAQMNYHQQQTQNSAGQNYAGAQRPTAQNIQELRRRINEVTGSTLQTPTQQQQRILHQAGATSRQQQITQAQQHQQLLATQAAANSAQNLNPRLNQVSNQIPGDGLNGVSITGASVQGSAVSHTSKMPPQVPISAQRRKILAAQHAAAQNIIQTPGQPQQHQQLNTQSSGSTMISPDNIIRPNGTRYSVQRNNMMSSPSPIHRNNSGNAVNTVPINSDQFQHRGTQPSLGQAALRRDQRLSQDATLQLGSNQFTPQSLSKLSQNDQMQAQRLQMSSTQRDKLQTAQIETQNLEKLNNPDFNLNLHPQQVAQSTSLRTTNGGESGSQSKVTGTDENDTNQEGIGPFSDGLSGDGDSEDVAVEFAEDPIEKTRFNNRRGQTHRAIPDRAKLEEMRDQAMNNFMLCPWVPGSQEEDKDDILGGAPPSGTQDKQAVKPPLANVNRPIGSNNPSASNPMSALATQMNNKQMPQRKVSPKQSSQKANQVNNNNGGKQQNAQSGTAQQQAAKQKIMDMQYPIWKEESIPDMINDDEDFDLLKERNYETLLDYDPLNEPQSLQQKTRQREEEAIANINFENFLIRQQQEEEEEQMFNNEETKSSRPAQYQNNNDSDDSDNNNTASGASRQIATSKSKRKRQGRGYVQNAFTINTSYCRSEVETLQHIIQLSGFAEVTVGGKLYWFGLSLIDKDIKAMMKKKVYYNRYPGLEYLCRKKEFCMINNRMRRTFPKLFNFSPISFLIPEEGQALEQYMEQHPKFFFIGKPSRGRGGEGIILISKFRDIPKNVFSNEEKDMLVQRYIKTPMLLDAKKFDLRLYLLVKGYDPVEAYLADEGIARLCTDNYRQPTQNNMKNMFMHLTNFSLNKNSENYKNPDENFQENNEGSKRLLSSLWVTLEEQGHDVALIKERIQDTCKKAIITMEPYLIHQYHTKVSQNHEDTKNFQILGMDILLDKKMNAWLMEVNANPSLNMFLEKDVPLDSNVEPEKIISELDKFVKTKVITESIRIVTGSGTNEFEGSMEQILPSSEEDYESYYIWNRGLVLFDLMVRTGKVSEAVSLFQFSKLARVPEFAKANQFFKADLDICFKNMQRKHDSQALDLHAFFDAIEYLSKKIYKDEEAFEVCLTQFLDASISFFEEQQTNTKTQ